MTVSRKTHIAHLVFYMCTGETLAQFFPEPSSNNEATPLDPQSISKLAIMNIYRPRNFRIP